MYDLMSDAFVWSDEMLNPSSLTQGELGALRALLRYRTSLITGVRDDRFQDVWSQLKSSAVGWVGFAENRCRYSQKLAEQYLQLKSRTRPKRVGKQP